ncbi:MAG: fructosamine kinase family protein [Bdellovibrionales bacterium]|nr:fructosamine kinase family protein [Bdellovibrionales bacterium]
MSIESSFRKIIEDQLEEKITNLEPLSGGCSYPSYVVECGKSRYFLKSSRESTDAFIKEAHGLDEINKAVDIVPKVYAANTHFLILDYIETQRPTLSFWHNLAERLAHMHRYHRNTFGFYEDNFIGPSPQKNTGGPSLDWGDFFWHNRIEFQLGLNKKQHGWDLNEKTLKSLEALIKKELSSFGAQPCLLHGDLWSGNIVCGKHDQGYLIDPAVYYGDREADMAFTELFGGFSEEFYKHYNDCYPLHEGFKKRKVAYNLYHLLNHFYLFGSTYKGSVESSIKTILQWN